MKVRTAFYFPLICIGRKSPIWRRLSSGSGTCLCCWFRRSAPWRWGINLRILIAKIFCSWISAKASAAPSLWAASRLPTRCPLAEKSATRRCLATSANAAVERLAAWKHSCHYAACWKAFPSLNPARNLPGPSCIKTLPAPEFPPGWRSPWTRRRCPWPDSGWRPPA